MDGHSGCLHPLVTVNVGVRVSVPVAAFLSILLGKYPEVGLLGHIYGSSIFSFLRNLQTVCHSSKYIPPAHKLPISLRPRQHLFCFLQQPCWCVWVGTSTGLIAFLRLLVMLGTFSCSFGHLNVFLREMSKTFAHFLTGLFFCCWFGVLYIF